MELTYLDSNSWLLDFNGCRILLDPWLVGPLVFGNSPWLFKGTRPIERPIPGDIDVILLSQGLPDHAHPPTLEQLGRSLPVVGSAGAAKVARGLGYEEVVALSQRQIYTWGDRLQIQAFPGSPIGPTTVENAYVISDLQAGTSLYYEPHGNHSSLLKDLPPIDVAIAPLVNLELPLVGPFIKGKESALELVQWIKPQYILPTAAGGDVNFEGLLVSILKASGTPEEFQDCLRERQLQTDVINPVPWTATTLSLARSMESKSS
ncbi:MBL fold metallo-hydrolase [Phormidium yuhuli AB48]|uniref:MBL fold metallo-hydrolase n=1 Tax=Phormidium yuhuli AB48 TaxID=2940671 RepID=A0ABY5AN86_9CYAN|nr:MBL fold metallo-hydrolase [Phormidium yuhuli]USR90470.1 MBL fold metallo-hydrolase [Phormidium yuhuli AB48]